MISATGLATTESRGPGVARYEEALSVEGEFGVLLGSASQDSTIGAVRWDVELVSSADTEFSEEGTSGIGSSSCHVSFEIKEEIDILLKGEMFAYDGEARITLGSLFSRVAETEGDGENGLGSPGQVNFHEMIALAPGTYRLEMDVISAPVFGGSGSAEAGIEIEFIPRNLAAWRKLYSMEGVDLTSDHDGDGTSLFLEYALGMDPGTRDRESDHVGLSREGGWMRVRYPILRYDLDYIVEWSTDLRQWNGQWNFGEEFAAVGWNEVSIGYSAPPAGVLVMRVRPVLRE